MELEELQATWAQMSVELEKQKRLTNEIILKMTQRDYKDRLNKVAIPEKISTVFTFGVALLLLFKFHELDTLLLRICGVITLAMLIILPIISLRYLIHMHTIDIINRSYTEGIKAFAINKQRYQKFLKLTVYLGFVLMLIIIPVISKIFNGKDIFTESHSNFWMWFVPIGACFYYLFSKRVINCYSSNIKKAGDILEELK